MNLFKDITLVVPDERDLESFIKWERDDVAQFMMGTEASYNAEDLKKFYINITSYDKVRLIKLGNSPIGYMKATISVSSRATEISMYIEPAYRDRGITQAALYKFLILIFEVSSYHKVSFSVFEFNKASLNNFRDFHEDGRLRDEKWYQGRYWDKIIYSVLESEWPALKASYEDRIQRVNEYYRVAEERRKAKAEAESLL